MQEQAFLDELEQLGLLEIEDSVKWKMHRLDITQDFYVKCDPSLMVKIIRYSGSVDPYRKGRALHYNQHNEMLRRFSPVPLTSESRVPSEILHLSKA